MNDSSGGVARPCSCGENSASTTTLLPGDWVALQIDDARVGEGRYADQVALQRPAERHRVVGVAEWEILPRAVQSGGACHCGEPQRSIIGEAVVWPVAQVGYGHPKRIPHAVTIGEMPSPRSSGIPENFIPASASS